MKVIDLIQEIEDILETAGGFPLTGKVMVDPGGDTGYPQGNTSGTSGRNPAGSVDKK